MQEQIAIYAFNRNREIQALMPLFSVVDPKKIDRLVRNYHGVVYPEHKYDEFAYMKRAKTMFDKLRKMEFRIKV